MKTLTCLIWICASLIAAVLSLVGYVLMMPGRAVTFVGESMLEWLEV